MIYQKPSLQFKKDFFKLTDSAENILITSHKSPDDDSIGSVLSMLYILNEKYPDKKIRIIYSGEIQHRWTYFENFNQVENTNDISDILDQFDLAIFLDQSQYQMFADKPDNITASGLIKIAIDHHGSDPHNFDLLLHNKDASSATELIYYSFCQDEKLPARLAETLLLGILGDTGTLRYVDPSQTQIYSVVGKLLMTADTRVDDFRSKYDGYSLKVFETIREFIKNAQVQKAGNWPDSLTSYITWQYIENNQLSETEVNEGASIFAGSYLNVLTEVPWGFITLPYRKNQVKVEARSKTGAANVRLVMEGIGIGGGHDRAAGGIFKDKQEPKDCLEEIINWLKSNPPKNI